MYRFIALTGLLIQPAFAQAQVQDTTLTRTVVVEQEYTPEIVDAAKVNVLPRVEPPTAVKSAVEYATILQPVADVPAAMLPVYEGESDEVHAKRGYARLGYGTHGNVDAYGSYLLPVSRRDKVRFDLGFDGNNGELDYYSNPLTAVPQLSFDPRQWCSRTYRTRLNAAYLHDFRRMELGINAGFGLLNYNLPPLGVHARNKHTDMQWGATLRTTDERPLSYSLGVDYRTFRTNYSRYEGVLEQNMLLKGTFSYLINETKSFGADVRLSNYRYTKLEEHDYFLLHGRPYYTYRTEDWQVDLGANIDLVSEHESHVNITPDVKFQYNLADGYVVYAKATGGVIANDFRRIFSESLYGYRIPEDGRFTTTREKINVALGARMSPLDELWIHLYGGYCKREGEIVNIYDTGSYSEAVVLNYLGLMNGGQESYAPGVTVIRNLFIMKQAAVSNAYVGFDVQYKYKDLFALNVETLWRKWSDKAMYHTGVHYFKPVFEAGVRMEIRPLPALLLEPGYRYAGYRQTYNDLYLPVKFRRDPVSDLYLQASYELKPDFRLYVRAHNLLNKKYEQQPYVYAQKTNLLLGVSVNF